MSMCGREPICRALSWACSSARMMAHSLARWLVGAGEDGRRWVQIVRWEYLFVITTAAAAMGPAWLLWRQPPLA